MSTVTENFAGFGLHETLLRALEDVGYEAPSPIQAACLPPLLEGRDVFGQAQTGTGKTAAFALPMLQRLDLTQDTPQALVLTPTRELALQVAEALRSYARHIPGVEVLAVYGGQGMGTQLRALRGRVHIVVGTPGRVMDHVSRGTLQLAALRLLVLDEADEMLRMGFIDDVEWLLERMPAERQMALFSATLPQAIRAIARRHMHDPREIHIASATTTVASVRQRYWQVRDLHKQEVLTRLLEVEDVDAALVFVRTKIATSEVADQLIALGFAAAALHGDMNQQERERTIAQLKNGRLNVVVATDVAARGLDVARISHVINFDVPADAEAYVHRIGRTGRAGRAGEAIVFVFAREVRLLRVIERSTGQRIEAMAPPTLAQIAARRLQRFEQRVLNGLTRISEEPDQSTRIDFIRAQLLQLCTRHDVEPMQLAALLARMLEGDAPTFLTPADIAEAEPPGRPVRDAAPWSDRMPRRVAAPMQIADEESDAAPEPGYAPMRTRRKVAAERGADEVHVAGAEQAREHPGNDGRAPPEDRADRQMPDERSPRAARPERAVRETRDSRNDGEQRPVRARSDAAATSERGARAPARDSTEVRMARYRIEVGREHKIEVRQIVGAIANEAGIDGRYIGRIEMNAYYSTLDLPADMPRDMQRFLAKVRVGRYLMRLSEVPDGDSGQRPEDAAPARVRRRVSEVDAERRPERRPDSRTDARSEHRPDRRPDSRPDARPERNAAAPVGSVRYERDVRPERRQSEWRPDMFDPPSASADTRPRPSHRDDASAAAPRGAPLRDDGYAARRSRARTDAPARTDSPTRSARAAATRPPGAGPARPRSDRVAVATPRGDRVPNTNTGFKRKSFGKPLGKAAGGPGRKPSGRTSGKS